MTTENTLPVINFNLAQLQKIINDSKPQSNDRENDFTPVSFLQEGTHKLRIFLDPESQIFRQLPIHQFSGKKTLCPDILNQHNAKSPIHPTTGLSEWAMYVQSLSPEWKANGLTKLPDCEICAAAQEIDHWRSGLGTRWNYMIYATLYETTVPGDYWEPNKENGKVYVILGNSKMRNAINSMLESLAADAPDFILSLLNPTVPSNMLTMTVTKGKQGSVQCQAIPGINKPAIIDPTKPTPGWWRPLSQVYVPKDFNLEAYTEAVEVARDKLTEHRANTAAGKSLNDAGELVDASVADAERIAKEQAEATSKSAETTQQTQVASTAAASVTTDLEPGYVWFTKSPSGPQKIKLPPVALAEECWTKFSASTPKCMTCSINLQCMSSQ